MKKSLIIIGMTLALIFLEACQKENVMNETEITKIPVVESTLTKVPEPTEAPKATVTSEPTNTPEPTSTPEPTNTPEPTATPKPTNTPVPTSNPGQNIPLSTYIMDHDGKLEVDGEWYNAVAGETGALIWKKVEAGFDTTSCYMTAFVADQNDRNVSDINTATYKAERISEWIRWDETDYLFSVEHVGEDMFLILKHTVKDFAINEKEYFYYNAAKDFLFSEKSTVFWNDKARRITEFHDGRAMGVYCEYDYTWKAENTKIGFLQNMGIFDSLDIHTWTNIGSEDESFPLGIYSDGVFYYDRSFYDMDSNRVLLLDKETFGVPYVKQGVYAPYFENGVCRLITQKNGKYWAFDIDKEGKILSEIIEVNIYYLGY